MQNLLALKKRTALKLEIFVHQKITKSVREWRKYMQQVYPTMSL